MTSLPASVVMEILRRNGRYVAVWEIGVEERKIFALDEPIRVEVTHSGPYLVSIMDENDLAIFTQSFDLVEGTIFTINPSTQWDFYSVH